MSEGNLTLAHRIQQLDGYDDELLIWARARTDLADLTPDTEAVVAPRLEHACRQRTRPGLKDVLYLRFAEAFVRTPNFAPDGPKYLGKRWSAQR